MESVISYYFSEVENPRVEGRCLHLLSDILGIPINVFNRGYRLSRHAFVYQRTGRRIFRIVTTT